MTMLTLTLTAFLTQLPIILVLLIGFILSSVYRRRHPKVSLLTAIATAGFLAGLLIRTFLLIGLPTRLSVIPLSVLVLLAPIFWGLLLTAIFGWRGKPGDASLSLIYAHVSLLTAIATAGLLVSFLVRIIIGLELGMALTTRDVNFSLLSAVFWGLLLTAIFGWRGRPGETSGNRPGETSGNDTSSLINFRNKVLGLESEMMSKLGLAIHATWVLILVSIGIVIPFLCVVAFVWGGGLESMDFLQMFIPGVVISGIFAGPPIVFYALSFWQRFKGRKSG